MNHENQICPIPAICVNGKSMIMDQGNQICPTPALCLNDLNEPKLISDNGSQEEVANLANKSSSRQPAYMNETNNVTQGTQICTKPAIFVSKFEEGVDSLDNKDNARQTNNVDETISSTSRQCQEAAAQSDISTITISGPRKLKRVENLTNESSLRQPAQMNSPTESTAEEIIEVKSTKRNDIDAELHKNVNTDASHNSTKQQRCRYPTFSLLLVIVIFAVLVLIAGVTVFIVVQTDENGSSISNLTTTYTTQAQESSTVLFESTMSGKTLTFFGI